VRARDSGKHNHASNETSYSQTPKTQERITKRTSAKTNRNSSHERTEKPPITETKRPPTKTPPNTERNPKNTRKQQPPTLQAKQQPFNSRTVAKQHQNKPKKPAKQQNNP